MKIDTRVLLCAAAALALGAGIARAGDEHWSRQFGKPADISKLAPNTGMINEPRVHVAKWHEGKLYMGGNWPTNHDLATGETGNRWTWLWTWSPEHGYEVLAHFGLPRGGAGPNGRVHDFIWLPDGRMVVGGEFQQLDNPGGTRFFHVKGLAVYDPKEPTADKWRPMGGSFQYHGSMGGPAVKSLAFDPQSNSIYVGGSFTGIPKGDDPFSPGVHRLDLASGMIEAMPPGLRGGNVNRVVVDTRTKPSTVYVGGDFLWTAGNGRLPTLSPNETTARFSVALASYQEGKGWTTYPPDLEEGTRGGNTDVFSGTSLRPGGDGFLCVRAEVHDILLDGDDLWIVGSFRAGTKGDRTLHGIAKWDRASKQWIDPTGKGGVGRDVYAIGKAANGKLYFAGGFGGRATNGAFVPGFKDGAPAHMAISYDPKTGAWEQLGSGLSSGPITQCELAIDGDDVYFVGDFKYIGAGREGKEPSDREWESFYIARWNETIDFTKSPAQAPAAPTKPANVFVMPTRPLAQGNEHWSRAFPERQPRSNRTGMFGSEGNVSTVLKHGDTLYFSGRWPLPNNVNAFVWSYHPERGWEDIAWKGRGNAGAGVQSPPDGIKLHDGKLYAFGAIESHHGLGVYDLASKTWSQFEGTTADGKPVVGNGAPSGGTIDDVAFAKNGDIYLFGSHKVPNPDISAPDMAGRVIRVDAQRVYHPMGWAFGPLNPSKPTVHWECLLLDETRTPLELYVAGTWGYSGPVPYQRGRLSYNIARWNHETKDWDPLGKGNFGYVSKLDLEKYFPQGAPGLPGMPYRGSFVTQSSFHWVRCMAMGADGNLYVGGNIALLAEDDRVAERRESFGIARWNRATDLWEPVPNFRGFSGDVKQMTFLDERRLLVSGNFDYDERWRVLNNVAILDVTTGEVSPLGGGLIRSMADTNGAISSEVVHCVDGDDYYFAGLFDYAGVRGNDLLEGPVESHRVAHWNAKRNFDPNVGLVVPAQKPVKRPTGTSSATVRVPFEVQYSGPGKVVWYERRTNGDLVKKGEGLTYTASLRLSGISPAPVMYVCVLGQDGVEGGKLAVRAPFE